MNDFNGGIAREWRQLILEELRRLDRENRELRKDIQRRLERASDSRSALHSKVDELERQLSTQLGDVKESIYLRRARNASWGVLGGAIAVFMIYLAEFLAKL